MRRFEDTRWTPRRVVSRVAAFITGPRLPSHQYMVVCARASRSTADFEDRLVTWVHQQQGKIRFRELNQSTVNPVLRRLFTEITLAKRLFGDTLGWEFPFLMRVSRERKVPKFPSTECMIVPSIGCRINLLLSLLRHRVIFQIAAMDQGVHPHISERRPCFGSENEKLLGDLARHWKVSEIFKIIERWSLMMNPGDAYVHYRIPENLLTKVREERTRRHAPTTSDSAVPGGNEVGVVQTSH